jgi:hypothetical protein
VPKIQSAAEDDALVSGAGNDVMTGGFGYVFNALNQSGVGNSDLTSRVRPRWWGHNQPVSTRPNAGVGAIRSLRSSARPRSQPPVNCESGRADDTVIQANTNANTSTLKFELHLLGPRPLKAGDFVF